MEGTDETPARPGRRRILGTGLGAGAAGLALGAVGGAGAAIAARPAPEPPAEPLYGRETVPCHGEHQAGVETQPQAHAALLGLDLRPETDSTALLRLFRILTEDITALTQGRAPVADTEPELALAPARLTVTVGVGPHLVETVGAPAPAWLAPLPPFAQIDQLEEGWSDGDLYLQVCGDDPLAVAHAQRMLLKSVRSFATVRWVQQGFRNARGAVPGGTTQRNLFGQIDGTINPAPDSPDFSETVWIREGWMAGGTSLVLRRIRMDLETWDELDRPGRELAIGRRLDTGAPLTGEAEHDVADFEATNERGFRIIPEFSHMARATAQKPGERILRRPYNYDLPPAAGQTSESGLLFLAYQADVTAQFLPIQQRLAELDLLNQWTVPIGSSVFAILPGFAAGEMLGQPMFDAAE